MQEEIAIYFYNKVMKVDFVIIKEQTERKDNNKKIKIQFYITNT